MEFSQNFHLFFHMFAFFLRGVLEFIFLIQFVAIFYLQTVDEVTHASFMSLIWLLHPVTVYQDVRSYLRRRGDPGQTFDGSRITNWTSLKTFNFFAGLNLIQIRTQSAEAAIYDYIRGDLKQSLERASSIPKSFFKFFTLDNIDATDSPENPETNTTGWFQLHILNLPRKTRGLLISSFSKGSIFLEEKEPTTHDVSQDTLTVAKGNKIEELEELGTEAVTEDAAPKVKNNVPEPQRSNSVTELLGAPSFLELKSMWGDRIRKRKPH